MNNKGYAKSPRIRSSGSATEYGHVLAYLILHGAVPPGLELDHKCRTTICVNPDHLEPVTHAENIRRGRSAQLNREVTHCPRGHAYDAQNTQLYQGRRFCKACAAIAKREYKKQKRSGVPSKKQLITTIATLCDLIRAIVSVTALNHAETEAVAVKNCPNCESSAHDRCCARCGKVHTPACLHHEHCSTVCDRAAAEEDRISAAMEEDWS